MAARDKKAPAGSGLTNKKQNSGVSPVPLRESNLQTPLTNTMSSSSSSSSSQAESTSLSETQTPTENDGEISTQQTTNEEKPENVRKGLKKDDDKQNKNKTETTTQATEQAEVRKMTPKRGSRRLSPVKRNVVGIKNKLKTELKAKNKTIKRKTNISKKIATAANIEFEENPEKKTMLLKNGIRNTTKLKKDIEEKTASIAPIIKKKPLKKLTNWGKKLGEYSPTIVEKHLENLDQVISEMIANVACSDDDGDKPSQDTENQNETPTSTATTPTKKGRKIVKKNILGPTTVVRKKPESAKRQKMVDRIAKDTELDSDAQNVINQLDLIVTANLEKTVETKKRRRHSIEKAANFNVNDNKRLNTVLPPDFTTQFLSTIIPRSGSPRSKRGGGSGGPRIRQAGVDLLRMRTRSPYSTRSDSPARILRNGKHRKLKDTQLLDGTEIEYKKKRRIHSDSREGSEISKNSGYWSESESSYCESTVSAIENGIPDIQMDVESLKTVDEAKKEIVEVPVKNEEDDPLLMETSTPDEIQTDVNENNNSSKVEPIKEKLPDNDASTDTKQISTIIDQLVPEKVIILNKMAKNFNDIIHPENEETTWKKVTTRGCTKKQEEIVKKSEVLEDACVIEQKTVVASSSSSSEDDDDDNKKPIISDNNLEISDNSINCNNSIENTSDFVLKLEMSSEDISLSPRKDSIDQEIKEETFKVLENIVDQISNEHFDTTTGDTKLTEETSIENILKCIDDVSIPMESSSPSPTIDTVLKPLDLNTVVIDGSDVILQPKSNQTENSLENILITASTTNIIIETPENQVIKESILSALGLQSLKAAAEAKVAKSKRILNRASATDAAGYTGTLKTVIKINRSPEKKKGRGHLKMTFQKSKSKNSNYASNGDHLEGAGSSPDMDNTYYKVMKEVNNTGWSTGAQSSDTAGANRKSHYPSNRSNTDGSSEHMSDEGGPGADGEEASGSAGGKAKTLVIPEKASSFSIHPHRLCRDECCYCFGRFGLFDTPCHIAQMKSSERQRKILEIEKHLTPDSCLCDACYRHVDRKANVPSYSKQYKRSNSAGPTNVGPRICHAMGCQQDASHSVRRKWILKMKRNLNQCVQFDLDPSQGLHSVPVCEAHFEALERLMACAMCKRRLPRNHAHTIDLPEAELLNEAFERHKLPIRLATASTTTASTSSTENGGGAASSSGGGGGSVVCKLCNYWASLLLKPPDNARAHTVLFFESYEKKLLHFHDGDMLDDPETDEPPFTVPKLDKDINKQATKKNKKKLSKTFSSKHHNNNNNNGLALALALEQQQQQQSSSSSPQQQQQQQNDEPPPLTAITQELSGGNTGTTTVLPEEMVQSELMEIDGCPLIMTTTTTDQTNNSDHHDTSFTKDSQRVPSTNNNLSTDEIQKSRSNSPKIDNENDIPENAGAPLSRTNKEVPHKAIFLRRLPKDSKYIVELHKVGATTASGKDGSKKPSATTVAATMSGPNQKVVERLETNPSISVRQLFPGEDDLSLQGAVEFGNVKERTPEGWEKCAMTIQYDHDTKRLWQELQKPYGNHSSFLRHLILLEKYFRNGDLVLTPTASHHATNYCESVQNRLRAYDNIPSGGNIQPLAMLPFNNTPLRKQQTISQSGIITGTGNGPIRPLMNLPKTSTPTGGYPHLPPNFISPVNIIRQQQQQRPSPSSVPPPGLIQLQSGGGSTSSSSRSQSTLLRFPTTSIRRPFNATNNRIQQHKQQQQRPTLIPLTHSKVAATVTSGAFKQNDGGVKRAPGLVQVMSGGKAYHLSIHDYNRMCAIKQREGIDLRPIPKKLIPSGNNNNIITTGGGGVLNTVSVLRQRSPALTTTTTVTTPKDSLGTNCKSVLEQLKSSVQNLNDCVVGASPPNLTQISNDSPNIQNSSLDKKQQQQHVMILPKIPKSLTVIPQTVRKSDASASSQTHSSSGTVSNTTSTTPVQVASAAASVASSLNNKQPS